MKLPNVKTPQFRTLLLRRLKNMFPGYSIRIEGARIGITFQLFDEEGRPQTGRISMGRAHSKALTKRTLTQKVRASAVGTL